VAKARVSLRVPFVGPETGRRAVEGGDRPTVSGSLISSVSRRGGNGMGLRYGKGRG
jgi:hypothetical protein